MKKYIYETEVVTFNKWTARPNSDYLHVINERGERGWRFVNFVPGPYKPKELKGQELIFEKEVSMG